MNNQFDFDTTKLQDLIEHKEQASATFRDLGTRIQAARKSRGRLQAELLRAAHEKDTSAPPDERMTARIAAATAELERLTAARERMRSQFEDAVQTANICEDWAREQGWRPDLSARPGASLPTDIQQEQSPSWS